MFRSSEQMSSSDMSVSDGTTTRSSPKKIADVVSNFCPYKRKLVSDIGFQGLLKVNPIPNLNRKFTISLLNLVDHKKRAIRVAEGNFLDITASEVHRYFDIPIGPNKLFGLEDRSESEKMDFIRFGIGSSCFDIDEKNSLRAAEEIITADYPNGMSEAQIEQFKVSFVCFAMGNFLLAKYSYNHGIKDFWGSLMKPSEIHTYNFCQAVVDEIFESARYVQRETKANRQVKNISGCHLFLQALYLDSRRFGILNLPDIGIARIQLFTCDIFRQLMNNVLERSKSTDGFSTPISGIRNVVDHVSKTNSSCLFGTTTPLARTDMQPSVLKHKSTAYLTDYTSVAVDRRLNNKQIDALRLHNARMKLFIHNFKTKALIDLQQYFLANPQSKEMFRGNMELLLNQVLDQVFVLSKSLHENSHIQNPEHSDPFNTSTKRPSDNVYFLDKASTDSSCVKKTKKFHVKTGKNLLPDLTEAACPSPQDIHTQTHTQAGFPTADLNRPNQRQPLSTSSSSHIGLNELSFSNPFVKTLAVPAACRHIELNLGHVETNEDEPNEIDLNQVPLNPDHIDSPVVKLPLEPGRIARNPLFFAVPRVVMDKEVAHTIYEWLYVTKSDILDSIWVNHLRPKPIIIAGNDFKSVFTRGYNFHSDLIDLAIRRFHQLDRAMYGQGVMLRWMHPFETDFARKVLNGERILNSISIRIQLLGNSDDYDISNCRMIAVPNLSGDVWTSYLWDMEEKIVHVLDPTFHISKASELHELHNSIVDKLQAGLRTCFSASFHGWEINWNNWKKNYIKPFLPGRKSSDSGLLALLAMRKFNGTKFELPQTEDAFGSFTKELLYDMLNIEDNRGVVPDVCIHSID